MMYGEKKIKYSQRTRNPPRLKDTEKYRVIFMDIKKLCGKRVQKVNKAEKNVIKYQGDGGICNEIEMREI